MTEVRIDKWLWAMRLFKTRSIAAEACKKGHIMIDGMPIKPSRMIKVGDIIQVRRQPIIFSFKVLALSQNRLGAKLVPEYMQQVTTPDQLELWEMLKLDKANNRAKGLGRPTKKDRRDLDEFFEITEDNVIYSDNYRFASAGETVSVTVSNDDYGIEIDSFNPEEFLDVLCAAGRELHIYGNLFDIDDEEYMFTSAIGSNSYTNAYDVDFHDELDDEARREDVDDEDAEEEF